MMTDMLGYVIMEATSTRQAGAQEKKWWIEHPDDGHRIMVVVHKARVTFTCVVFEITGPDKGRMLAKFVDDLATPPTFEHMAERVLRHALWLMYEDYETKSPVWH